MSRSLVSAAILACHTSASMAGDNWALFSSDSVNPKPIVWETEDWNNYSESKSAPFRRYSFQYPSEWTFSGYSVFHDTRKTKIAEIAPGVIALAQDQGCFESADQRTPRYKTFRLGSVTGRVIVGDTEFHDSPEKFRVYSYCIEQGRHAFTIMFLERKTGPSMAGTFRKVIRSFQFAPE